MDALTAAGFNVQQVNLSDEQAVAELVLRNESMYEIESRRRIRKLTPCQSMSLSIARVG